MSALDEYEGIWDMFVQMHRQTHGENHVPTRDFNCCGEYAVLMALRAASTLKPDYPHHLLLRMGAMQELDRDFYVKNLLATDGEPEPSDPEPLREYRASRRYHILWTELKEAAAASQSPSELAIIKDNPAFTSPHHKFRQPLLIWHMALLEKRRTRRADE